MKNWPSELGEEDLQKLEGDSVPKKNKTKQKKT